jgi:dTMP kinase
VSALVVAIEGIDGSGKGTQASLLHEALTAAGHSCGLIAFPRYSETVFGRTIARYLNGEFGDLHTAGPHFAALLYAGDRLESLPLIDRERASRDVVILDRYVPSNLAHQAAKLDPEKRESFIEWISAIEYGVYRLPRADLVIFLDMPVAMAQQLISRKPARAYTKKAADLHEADAEYLSRTAAIYHALAARDKTWQMISCTIGDQLRPAQQIAQDTLGCVVSAKSAARL